MAKRSPILGYNHNVLYRGLIFHVQTEDSGAFSGSSAKSHVISHLFHGGVIITTRKLVYDAGADEGAIKSLMQAQHKAVLKDLKRAAFDDKIDVYLAGTEGLLPRGVESGPVDVSLRTTDPGIEVLATPPAPVEGTPPVAIEDAHDTTMPISLPDLELDPVPAALARPQPVPTVDEIPQPSQVRVRLATPVAGLAISRTATPPPVPAIAISRTATPPPIPQSVKLRADTEHDPVPRGARYGRAGKPPEPPSPEEIDAPTLSDHGAGSIAAAIAAANAHTAGRDYQLDSSPEIEIQLELDDADDDPAVRQRRSRDTAVEMPELASDGIPGAVGSSPSQRVPQDSIPPLPPPPSASRAASSSLAASLPANPRTSTRTPGAITASGVLARPLPVEERSHEDSDAIELYAPPPADAAPPVGGSERPGQYSQHRRPQRIDGKADRSGSIPIPAGLGRPGRISNGPFQGSQASGPVPAAGAGAPSAGIPRSVTPQTTEPIPARAATASRMPSVTQARTGSTSSSGGVVMTRPAVIVGAPAKVTAPLPRVRKAREEEGRGFGQGLISEKSLDEVILAYLSEDADDK